MTRRDEESRLRHMLEHAVGLRQRLIHGYDGVDFNILWDIVRDDLPQLVGELELIFSNTDK